MRKVPDIIIIPNISGADIPSVGHCELYYSCPCVPQLSLPFTFSIPIQNRRKNPQFKAIFLFTLHYVLEIPGFSKLSMRLKVT